MAWTWPWRRGRGWGWGRGWWKGWGWSGKPWPGRGPWSGLPPWERPGWLLGPGWRWWMQATPLQEEPPSDPVEAERRLLEAYRDALRQALEEVEERLRSLERRRGPRPPEPPPS